MASVKKYLWACIVLALIGFTISCQKTNNGTPSIGSPILVLTPSSDSGYAGAQLAIDYSTTAINGVKRIQIFTQFLSTPKVTAKDSTLSSTSPAVDLNFDYTIPDSALRGQQSVITFIITDGKGNTTTKTATVTVTGSRPTISVTPLNPSVNAGDSVKFNIVMKSPDKGIQTLDVAQVTKANTDSSIGGFSYSGN